MNTAVIGIRELCQDFYKNLDPVSRQRLIGVRGLEECLKQSLSRAHIAHPQVVLKDTLFIEHLGRHLRLENRVEPLLQLERLRTEDLYLALGCAQGDPHALQHLEEIILPGIQAGLTKLTKCAGNWIDDFMQEARLKLLVSTGSREPVILRYSGQGKLFSWLNVVLRRDARHWLMKNVGRDIFKDDLAERLATTTSNPEVLLMKESLRTVLREVLQEILGKLGQKERTILSLNVIDGLNHEQIGVLYGAHRTTAMRWLEKIKREIHLRIRRELTDRLKLRGPRLDSAFHLLQSSMYFSLGGALGGAKRTAA